MAFDPIEILKKIQSHLREGAVQAADDLIALTLRANPATAAPAAAPAAAAKPAAPASAPSSAAAASSSSGASTAEQIAINLVIDAFGAIVTHLGAPPALTNWLEQLIEAKF